MENSIPSARHPSEIVAPKHKRSTSLDLNRLSYNNHNVSREEASPTNFPTVRTDSMLFAERSSFERAWSNVDLQKFPQQNGQLSRETNINEPVVLSGNSESDKPQKRRRRKNYLYLGVAAFLLLLLAIVGVGVGVSKSRSSSPVSANSDGDLPTITISRSPSMTPTIMTPAPTVRCPPILGPLVVNGLPVQDTLLQEPFECNPLHTYSRWFNVTGGDEVLVATLTVLDVLNSTTVTVIEAKCENLVCLTPGFPDRATWFGRKGRDYFVVVSSPRPLNFELVIEYDDVSQCDLASRIPNDGTIVPASVRGAGFQENILTCEFSRARAQLYFEFQGTGNPMLVTTCHDLTDFDARVNVLNATNCRGGCQTQGSSKCGPFGYSTVFQSERNVLYKVLIFKASIAIDLGNFAELSVQDVTLEPNNSCESAINLPLDSSSAGSTRLATINDEFACGGTRNPGVWYQIQGTGDPLLATTCNNSTNYASSIQVFRGSCSSLTCVQVGIQSCGSKGSVFFDTIAEETYYVLVHGESSSADPVVGEYTLELKRFIAAENDECPNAIQLDPNGDQIRGSTFDATPDNVISCDEIGSDASGVWYSVVPSQSRPLLATTCNELTQYDTQITVYRGTSCSALSCVSTNDNSCGFQSSVIWSAAAGVQYNILVHGRSLSSTGDFVLTLEPYEPTIANDFCDSAIAVLPSSKATVSTTETATFDNAITCGVQNTGPGVWYSVEGTGTELEISLCNAETDYDTALSVYTGDCVDLICVAGNGNAEGCGDQSVVRLVSELRRYYVLVHGFRERSGNFGLTVKEVEPVVSNDFCVRAQEVSISDEVINGTLLGATPDKAPDCVGILSNGLGVWYRVTAEVSGPLEASTCTTQVASEVKIDTKITVYRGDCASLECVRADDDGCGKLSRVVWDAIAGETFFVQVHTGPNGVPGPFDLRIRDFVSLQANDVCANALEIGTYGETLLGSTTASSYDNQATCGTENTAPGVWYFLVGTGERFVAETCSDDTFFDTKITVFTGTCDSLECVDGNDDACGFSSAVAWTTTLSQPYYILVHGFATQVGNFGLTVTDHLSNVII